MSGGGKRYGGTDKALPPARAASPPAADRRCRDSGAHPSVPRQATPVRPPPSVRPRQAAPVRPTSSGGMRSARSALSEILDRDLHQPFHLGNIGGESEDDDHVALL